MFFISDGITSHILGPKYATVPVPLQILCTGDTIECDECSRL